MKCESPSEKRGERGADSGVEIFHIYWKPPTSIFFVYSFTIAKLLARRSLVRCAQCTHRRSDRNRNRVTPPPPPARTPAAAADFIPRVSGRSNTALCSLTLIPGAPKAGFYNTSESPLPCHSHKFALGPLQSPVRAKIRRIVPMFIFSCGCEPKMDDFAAKF